MTKLAPEWVRTSDPVIRSPARYRWTTAPATGMNDKKENWTGGGGGEEGTTTLQISGTEETLEVINVGERT